MHEVKTLWELVWVNKCEYFKNKRIYIYYYTDTQFFSKETKYTYLTKFHKKKIMKKSFIKEVITGFIAKMNNNVE